MTERRRVGFFKAYSRQWPLWAPLVTVIVVTVVLFFTAGSNVATLASYAGTCAALAVGFLIGPRKRQ